MRGTPSGRTTVVLFSRDRRVHPALAEAAAVGERVVPLFVLDDSLLASDYARPNRVQFLLESLADPDESLRALGSRLAVRRSDPARCRCAAHGVEHRAFPGVTVAAPGAVLPSGGDHFRVFTPRGRG